MRHTKHAGGRVVRVVTDRGRAAVTVEGDIDHSTIGKVSAALRELSDSGFPVLVLDFANVTFIDSAGISALYDLADHVDGHQSIEITSPSADVRRILRISGVGSRPGLRMVPEERAAMGRQVLVAAATPQPESSVRPQSWSKTFPSQLGQLAEVRAFVREVAENIGLGSSQTFGLTVAVSEAAANAIEHGGNDGLLAIQANRVGGRLSIVVSHPGSFRVRLAEDPTRRHRGMGIPLMLALVDEVTVSHLPAGGTRVTLSLHLG